jgi:hypothetical protein
MFKAEYLQQTIAENPKDFWVPFGVPCATKELASAQKPPRDGAKIRVIGPDGKVA